MSSILHSLKNLKTKATQDTRMRFSVEPFACDSGFAQWHDAMKMCARLPGGIPQEFRRRMWLTLAEQHVRQQQINWKEVERNCFNEWSTPDDVGLGDQIVKDLHRTGCTLFCGVNAEDNQALLKRVLLGYARWNKAVGYCQGFNMLAAIILQVMDRQESDALKVMIYLIEGVLPESYFANNLRGLAVDMAVFRDLMRAHLPNLSCHLECLQKEASDLTTGACYEPPLTNVFTMQWFLTLFSNCLPKDAVMRVWDLTFLQGNEMLLRTALAIWGKIASRILEVQTADEFYTVMGLLTQQMLAQGLMDTNQLVQTLVGMAPFPFPGLANLRDKYTYNITPWAQSVSSVAKKGLRIFYLDDEDDDRGDNDDGHQELAVTAAFGLSNIFKKGSSSTPPLYGRCSPVQGQNRPNLDISSLKKQYDKLRERQKQAHVILRASHQHGSKQMDSKRGANGGKSSPLAMKHLLRGKKALASKTKRVVPQGMIPTLISKKKAERKLSDSTGIKQKAQRGIGLRASLAKEDINNTKVPIKNVKKSPPLSPTLLLSETEIVNDDSLLWKDDPMQPRRASLPYGVKLMENFSNCKLPDIRDDVSEKSSTSTELCDDEDGRCISDDENHHNTLSMPTSHDAGQNSGIENFSCDMNHKYISDYSETCNDKICDGEIGDNDILTVHKNKDITLKIPTILKAKNEQISLSSPTKWKWSFSEVKDPLVIKQVSPIITLHNFVSQEQEPLDDIPTSPQNCPKILLNSQNPNYIDSSFIQYDKNNMFSYLFEITDITKLSNNNSENTSPCDDDKFKYFDTDKLGKSLNNKQESTVRIEPVISIYNKPELHPNCVPDLKDSDIKSFDYSLRSKLHSNVAPLSPEKSSLQKSGISSEKADENSTEDCHDTISCKESDDDKPDGEESSNNGEESSNNKSINGSCVRQTCDIDMTTNGTNVIVNNIVNKLNLTVSRHNDIDTRSINISKDTVVKFTFGKYRTAVSTTVPNDDVHLEALNEPIHSNRVKGMPNFKETLPDEQLLENDVPNISVQTDKFIENNCSSVDIPLGDTKSKISSTESALLELKNKDLHKEDINDISETSPGANLIIENCHNKAVDVYLPADIQFKPDSSLISKDIHVDDLSREDANDYYEDIGNTFKTGIPNNLYDNYKHSSYFCQIFNDNPEEENIQTSYLKLQEKEPDLERSEELSSDIIRRRLWAGVKCLSLDAAAVYENMQERAIDSQFPSLPTLDESPGEIISSSVYLNKYPYRRNSDAALKLMTENTKMLDKFTRNMSEINETRYFLKEKCIDVEKMEDNCDEHLKENGQQQLAEAFLSFKFQSGKTLHEPHLLKKECYVDEPNINNLELPREVFLNLSNNPSVEKCILNSLKTTEIQSELVDIQGTKCKNTSPTDDKPLQKCYTNAVPFSKKSFLRPKLLTDNFDFQTIECQISSKNLDEEVPNSNIRPITDAIKTSGSRTKTILNPFPIKPLDSSSREVGVQLGLYCPINRPAQFL